MVIDHKHHPSDNARLRYGTRLSVFPHFHHIIVLFCACHHSRNEIWALRSCYSVARQRLYAPYKESFNVLRRIVEGYQVASVGHTNAKSSVAKKAVYLACSQSVAPTIDHYTVTTLENRFKSGALNGVNGQSQSPKGKEGYYCHYNGENGLFQSSTFNLQSSIFNLQYSIFNIQYSSFNYSYLFPQHPVMYLYSFSSAGECCMFQNRSPCSSSGKYCCSTKCP